jgi:hypothetical protein
MHAHQSATYCPRPAEMRYRHFLGSSGRRFKLPRSPRLGCAWRIQFRNASGGRSTARPAGGSRAWDPTPDTTPPRAQATRRDTCYSLPAKLPSSVYKIKPGSEVSGKTGEPHTAHSCGVLGTPTTIVSTRLTLFLACQGGEARHGCILRGARVRDHPAKRALKLRAVLAQAPPVLTSPNQCVIRACSGLAHCKTEGPTSRTVRRGRRRRRSGRPPFDI